MSSVNEISTRKSKAFFDADKIKQDNNRHAKDAADFGNNDYKSIIARNMKGSRYGDKGCTDEHKEV